MTTPNNDGKLPSTIWCWAKRHDEEEWQGSAASRDDAIAGGSSELVFEDNETSFYVAEFCRPKASTFFQSAENIVQTADENSMDHGAPENCDSLEASLEAEAELDAFLTAWADKHVHVSFFLPFGTAERVERTTDASSEGCGK